MPDVDINPSLPITIHATLDTPLRINVEFLYCLPKEKKWRSFFTAGVGHEIPNQIIETALDAVPEGTSLLLTMVFSGAKNMAYRGTIVLSQNGQQLGKKIAVNGSTGAKYSSFKEIGVLLT